MRWEAPTMRHTDADWPCMVVLAWARGKIGRIGIPEDDDLMGKIPRCNDWRRRFQVARAERGGEPCLVFGVFGEVLDTSPPF
jgi:hypothetical protein